MIYPALIKHILFSTSHHAPEEKWGKPRSRGLEQPPRINPSALSMPRRGEGKGGGRGREADPGSAWLPTCLVLRLAHWASLGTRMLALGASGLLGKAVLMPSQWVGAGGRRCSTRTPAAPKAPAALPALPNRLTPTPATPRLACPKPLLLGG